MTFLIRPVAILMLTLSLPGWLQRFTRDTNSRAASSRGVHEYQLQQFGPSAKDFQRAQELHPTPASAFNLGTAQIAAGNREEGSKALEPAIADPSLRAVALYNRGNSALAAKALESAVKDYEDSLRVRPSDPATKRNLEIALRQLEQQQKDKEKQQSQGGGKGKEPQQNAGGQKPQPQQAGQNQGKTGPPQGGGTNKQRGNQASETLLRAIQQQEAEELQRMKRARAEGQRVGW